MFNVATTTTTNVGDQFQKERRFCERIKQGCNKADEYNHPVIQCFGCLEAHQYRYPCNILDCICGGDGFLYPVEGNNKRNKAVHVFSNDSGSVRVDLQKPKQARERTLKRYNNLMRIQHHNQQEDKKIEAIVIGILLDGFEDLSYCALDDLIDELVKQELMQGACPNENILMNSSENFWDINTSPIP